jgi:flagellar motility protein MotE (MotC chaperone)
VLSLALLATLLATAPALPAGPRPPAPPAPPTIVAAPHAELPKAQPPAAEAVTVEAPSAGAAKVEATTATPAKLEAPAAGAAKVEAPAAGPAKAGEPDLGDAARRTGDRLPSKEKPAPAVEATRTPAAHAGEPAAAGEKATRSEVAPRPEPVSKGGGGGGLVPPSLSARALADELKRAAHERQAQQTALAEQQKKLEATQQDLARTRAAVKDETARLQALMVGASRFDKGSKAKPGARNTAGRPLAPQSPIDALAKTVKGMRAEEAAALLTKLDRGLAAAILSRMKPADSALVFEKLDPATGASLLALLAKEDRT